MSHGLNKNSKIAIIGAGAAGLHIGYLLRKRGFSNITIFDKNNEIGGKWRAEAYGDMLYDMGVACINQHDSTTLALLQELQIEAPINIRSDMYYIWHNDKAVTIHEYIKNTAIDYYTPRDSNLIFNIIKYINESLIYTPIVGSLFSGVFSAVKSHYTKKDLIKAIYEYMDCYSELVSPHYKKHSIPNTFNKRHSTILSINIIKFLGDKDISMIFPLITFMNPSTCYGHPESIPSYYGAYFARKDMLEQSLGVINKDANSGYKILPCSYNKIWSRLANRSMINIQNNKEVIQVIRCTKDCINLMFHDGTSDEFDFVISAIAAPKMIGLLTNPTSAELELLHHMTHSIVVSSIVKAKSEYNKVGVLYWPENLKQENYSNLFSIRNTKLILNNKPSKNQVFISHQHYNNEEELRQKLPSNVLYQTLENSGITVQNIGYKKNISYFYRFTQDAIKNGQPWLIEQIQGKNHMLYTGTSLSSPSLEAIFNYNQYLLENLGIT